MHLLPRKIGVGVRAQNRLLLLELGVQLTCGVWQIFYLTESVIKSFGKSQFPHESVNLSFIITNIKHVYICVYAHMYIPREIGVGVRAQNHLLLPKLGIQLSWRISSGREFIMNTQAQQKLSNTWII